MNEEGILADLRSGQTYEEVATTHGVSRGRVYAVALKHGARKNEARIQMRAEERRSFLQEVVNATATADVLDFLGALPSGSVKLHLTSPPYNIGKPYGDIPQADRLAFVSYRGWMMQVLAEQARTLSEGGVLMLQVGTTKMDDGQRIPLDIVFDSTLRELGLTYQNRVIWTIPHGLTPKHRLAERYETALIFSKGEPRVFNPGSARAPQKHPDKRSFKGPNRGKLSGHPLGAWPTDVWQIPNVGHNHPERTGHPAQFPEAVARRGIMLYTRPLDLVVDVFMGGGTTAAVAKQTHRAFSGCDLHYGDLRAKRLAAVSPDLVTALTGVSDRSAAIWRAEADIVRTTPKTSQAGLFEPGEYA